MRKKLNNPWVVGALAAIALVISILRLRAGAEDGVFVASAPADSAAAAPEAPLAPALAKPVGPAATFARVHPRDPFALRLHAVVLPRISETVRLSGLWTENGATLVLINDEIHKAGDEIGLLTVESASDDGVWILHDKVRAFLALGETQTFSVAPAPAAERPL